MTSLLALLSSWEDRALAMERAAVVYDERGEHHKAEGARLTAKSMRLCEEQGIPVDE